MCEYTIVNHKVVQECISHLHRKRDGLDTQLCVFPVGSQSAMGDTSVSVENNGGARDMDGNEKVWVWFNDESVAHFCTTDIGGHHAEIPYSLVEEYYTARDAFYAAEDALLRCFNEPRTSNL